MANFKVKNLAKVSSFAGILFASVFSCHTFAMTPFQASYQFQYNGKNVGSATRTLSKSGNQWNYVFAAKAVGLASAKESSQFTLNGSQIVSNNFNRTSKVLVHNKSMSMDFNPKAQVISTKKDDKSRSFSWKNGVLDELNAELQIREDLKKNALKSNYLIADAKEVESRQFIKQGTEKIKAGNTTYDTVKIVMKNTKPGRETIFWLAPSLDYAPVKVTHVDQKSSYGLLLTNYKDASI